MSNSHPQTGPTVAPPMLGRFGGPAGMTGKIERAKDTRGTIRRLWGYLKQQRSALLLTGVIVVALSILTVLGPYLLTMAIDRYIIPGDLPGLARICAMMLVVYLLTSLLTWIQTYVMAGAAQRTVRDIRNDLFGHMQQLPLRFFDKHAHGDLMSRLTNDLENVNMVLADGIAQIISGVLSMICLLYTSRCV